VCSSDLKDNQTCKGATLFFNAITERSTSGIEGWIDAGQFYISLKIDNNILVAYADENKNSFNPKDSLLFGKTIILKPNFYEKDTLNYAKIVKGKGIVEFFDNVTNHIWSKIPK
jgi:hypothetical protein